MEPYYQSFQENSDSENRCNSSSSSMEGPARPSMEALLLSVLVDWPCLLPQQSANPHAGLEPYLAIWSISGRVSAIKAFQSKLQSLSHVLEDNNQQILRLTFG